MENSKHFVERRRYPRFVIDLPSEYQMWSNAHTHGGLILNASERGLLLYSIGDMAVGARLRITVLFPQGYELANFEVAGQVIWKNSDPRPGWEGCRYGAKFIQIGQEEHWKLRQVLSSQSNLEGWLIKESFREKDMQL